MEPPPGQTEEELERFRQQWKAEVQARAQQTGRTNPEAASSSDPKPQQSQTRHHSIQRTQRAFLDDITEPQSYHDLEITESGRKLDGEFISKQQPEPKTALEHYERAVDKEAQGNLGESLKLYRKAFKLDGKVQDKYKTKYFPAKPAKADTSSTVPTSANQTAIEQAKSVVDLISDFSELTILGEAPPTDLSPAPPCPIAQIPDEVLVDILLHVAVTDVATFSRLSQVCKRLAFLVATEDRIWRRLIHDPHQGFPGMKYDFTLTIDWDEIIDTRLGDYDSDIDTTPMVEIPAPLMLPLTPSYPSYRHMFRTRPRIRFNGCYISTVNYTRPGAIGSNSWSWNAEILMVTYYRYLRFFRDGTVISLCSTAEPIDVVPYLEKEHLHYQGQKGGNLPQAVLKDSLKGVWRLSGDPFGLKAQRDSQRGIEYEAEQEGDIHVESQGVSKYKYIMQLRFGNAGKTTKNNKLNWVGYWNYNKLTDDIAEFELKNDRAFFWSRVKSWV